MSLHNLVESIGSQNTHRHPDYVVALCFGQRLTLDNIGV